MSLKYALLGFLNYESMTGYQLKKYFDESVGGFWNASLSQIYPTLNSMYEEGVVTSEEVQLDSLNKKIYSITAKGKEELLKWLEEPTEIQPLRSTLLLKLYFSSNISKEIVISQFESLIKQSRLKLEIYEKGIEHLRKEHLSTGYMKQEALYWNLTADYGVKHQEAFIKWCEECILKLKNAEKDAEGRVTFEDNNY
jgi:PadR family transcriptional regulator AphA